MAGSYSARRSRRAASPATWGAILVVVALAGAASVFIIESGSGPLQTSSTHTLTSTTSSMTSASAPSPAAGLELTLTLNATDVSAGGGVAATVEEVNTRTAPVNVSASKEWPIQDLAVGPCGPLNYPVGLAVLNGNYDAANASLAKPLQIYKPGAYACPMVLAGIDTFVFQASSDNATIFGSCQSSGGGCLTESVDASIAANGYWSGDSFTSFPSGVYTVVAGDEWGGIAILHFTVAGAGA